MSYAMLHVLCRYFRFISFCQSFQLMLLLLSVTATGLEPTTT